MPSLEEILKKTKSKSEQVNIIRKPVTIAEQDRPYINSDTPTAVLDPKLSNILEKNNTASSIEVEKKLNTNSTQSKHKVSTNQTQKPNTKHTQSKHKKKKLNTNSIQTQHKVHTKLNTRKTQSKHKVNTNYTQTTHISTLIGVQRRILLFIFEECKKARSHITEPLSIIHITNGLEIASGSIKTSISRLCEKSFLKINSFKNGRGGWSAYEIPNEVYKELLQMETQHKLHTKQTQTTHKVDTKLNTQLNTNASSSSSNILKTTTTVMQEGWNFDITSYGKFSFTNSQLKQLASLGVISAADVEQSLIEFNYDLENNSLPVIKTGKINFLMGLLRSGNSYVSEGFKSEQEVAISEMARRSRVRRENALKAKFEAWEASLSGGDREKVLNKLPTSLMVLEKTYGISNEEVRSWYYNFFINSPEISPELPKPELEV